MRTILISTAVLGLFTAGCGAPDASSQDPAPADRAELERELGTATEHLGEASCGTIPADETLDFLGGTIGAGVAGGSYGHPACTDGYVIDVVNVPANAAFTSGVSNPRWPDPLTCLLNWGYGSIWKKDGTGYTKIQEASTLGRWVGVLGNAICYATVPLTAPTAGSYRIVTSAGFLFGPKQSAGVTR